MEKLKKSDHTLPPINITIEKGKSKKKDYSFTQPFSIGRDVFCDIILDDYSISRQHLKVFFKETQWYIRDLKSSNGTFIDGKKIACVPLSEKVTVTLGNDGPIATFHVVKQTRNSDKSDKKDPDKKNDTLKYFMDKYGNPAKNGNEGEHTMFVRQAVQHLQKKQKKKYYIFIGAITTLLIAAACLIFYQYRALKYYQEMATGLFYQIKQTELEIAQIKDNLRTAKFKKNLAEMNKNYDEYLNKIGIYKKNMDQKDKIIFQIARNFGECELHLPKGFIEEVKKYIGKWKTSQRLKKSIMEAERNNYAKEIADQLGKHGLTNRFFYLALQESDFNLKVCGPKTRYGYAKGMWQFIPETGKRYGLKIGPLYNEQSYDPDDERFNFKKSTISASKYLKDIYNTDAQASGLLVMASYNWGERRVIKLINTMPMNPRERNFWSLLTKYKDKIPKQTYDYVFYIFSAAVIGEDPKLFGFDFANPLPKIQ